MKPWVFLGAAVILALGAVWLSILAIVGVFGDGFGAVVTGGRVDTGFTDGSRGMRLLRDNADLVVFGLWGASVVCLVVAVAGWIRR